MCGSAILKTIAVAFFLHQGLWDGVQCNNAENSVALCPNGWSSFGAKCYKVFGLKNKDERETWDNANRKCLHMNSTLVSIHSKEEEEFIWQMMKEEIPNADTWIGLRLGASISEVYSHWTDNSPVNYSNWLRGQPTFEFDGKKQECVEMLTTKSSYASSLLKKWNDQYCSEVRIYVCQIGSGLLCGINTCENGGSCSQDGSNRVFVCECPHGYEGQRCEQRILCGINTCENGGTCSQDGSNGVFVCECPHGYEGQRCEQRILCGSNACENAGTCSQDATDGVFVCECQHGYEGLRCEQKNLGGDSTCENGGTCAHDVTDGVFTCECPYGYEGLKCENKILCDSNTCKNEGSCTQDGLNGVFRCICKGGYNGLTCEESIVNYKIEHVGGEDYLRRGNVVLHVEVDVKIQ